MYIALYLRYTVIHKNGGIFRGFSLTKFHYHELVATFAKHDDFIMKHTDFMYINAVYSKCIVYIETIIFF